MWSWEKNLPFCVTASQQGVWHNLFDARDRHRKKKKQKRCLLTACSEDVWDLPSQALPVTCVFESSVGRITQSTAEKIRDLELRTKCQGKWNDRRERKDVKCVVDEWLLPQDVPLLGHNWRSCRGESSLVAGECLPTIGDQIHIFKSLFYQIIFPFHLRSLTLFIYREPENSTVLQKQII